MKQKLHENPTVARPHKGSATPEPEVPVWSCEMLFFIWVFYLGWGSISVVMRPIRRTRQLPPLNCRRDGSKAATETQKKRG